MSEDRFGAQLRSRSAGGPVSQTEIDDVLNDPRLSPSERQARLGELRQRILDDRHADGDEEYEPLGAKIADALSMLAEGGHDYAGSLHVEGGDPTADVERFEESPTGIETRER